jgi:hypothetical protein
VFQWSSASHEVVQIMPGGKTQVVTEAEDAAAAAAAADDSDE